MAPNPSTCIACRRVFAENRELAAIPDASKIAFDPVHLRVWRICSTCGEWNLLGADASAAALPELEARFTSAAPKGAPELRFAPAKLSGRLELLRVGQSAVQNDDGSAALRLRQDVDKRARMMRWFTLSLGAGVVGWCVFVYVLSDGDRGVPTMMLLLYSGTSLLSQISDKLRGKTVTNTSLLANACLVGAGIWLMLRFLPAEHLGYMAFGFLFVSPYIFVVEPLLKSRIGVVRVQLADGSKIRVPEPAISRLTLAWTPGGTDLSLHDLPNTRSLTGPDVAIVFRKAAPWLYKMGLTGLVTKMNAITENAYNLVSSVGGLGGLLHALDGFRRDNDGRVPIANLPMVYLVALDLAFAAQLSGADASNDLSSKASEAAAIAREAEKLDRQ